VKFALGQLARSGIEARVGPDLSSGVELALENYARLTRSGGELPQYPRFREADDGPPSPEQLAAHAVLVYLAELDRAGIEVLPTPARS
jgi:hypothetical protein